MTTLEIQIEERNKILEGLEKTYQNLLLYKKNKNSTMVILQNKKIVKINPK